MSDVEDQLLTLSKFWSVKIETAGDEWDVRVYDRATSECVGEGRAGTPSEAVDLAGRYMGLGQWGSE